MFNYGVKEETAMNRLRLQYNSPVVLSFALCSLAALLIGNISYGWANTYLFSVYRSSLSDPLTYLRAFLHVLGHANWQHYTSNVMLMLVIGPQLEEKYGSRQLLTAIVITAFFTGLAQWVLFPGVGVMGASGIVFMMILLASMGGMRDGYVPLTLILVALFYIGSEVSAALGARDDISQMSHIIGGICGAVFGFTLSRRY